MTKTGPTTKPLPRQRLYQNNARESSTDLHWPRRLLGEATRRHRRLVLDNIMLWDLDSYYVW